MNEQAKAIARESRLILKELRKEGFDTFKIYDEDECRWYVPEGGEKALIEHMSCCDEIRFGCKSPDNPKKIYVILLVWGNEPGVAMADFADDERISRASQAVNEVLDV